MRHVTKIVPKHSSVTAAAAMPLPDFAAEPTKSARATDEVAIGKLIAAHTMAWNHHDHRARAELLSEDATLITPSGRTIKGRSALLAMFTAPGPTDYSTFKVKVDSIQWLAPKAALVDTTEQVFGMMGPDGLPIELTTMHVVVVVQKMGSAWFVTAIRPYQFVKNGPSAPVKPAAN